MPSSRLLSSSAIAAALVLAQGCISDHTHDDAGPSPPDAIVVCAEPTPVDQFDALVPRILDAIAHHPGFPLSRYYYDSDLAYVRARIVAGAVVIDATRVDACLARLPLVGPFENGPLCADVFRPRCTAPTLSRCGTDIDCAREDFCDQSPDMQPCARLGHCTPRAPLGGPCPDQRCAWPDTGIVICADATGSRSVCHALTSQESATLGSPCGVLVAGTDGVRSVLPLCAAPLVCVATGDATTLVLQCDAVTTPGTVAEGHRCSAPSDCVASTTCDEGFCSRIPGTCDSAVPDACPHGFACVGGACLATDGSVDAPCGRHSGSSDCAIGLACGSDLHCGPLLADGAAVDWLTPGECASMCATATVSASGSITNERCVPLDDT